MSQFVARKFSRRNSKLIPSNGNESQKPRVRRNSSLSRSLRKLSFRGRRKSKSGSGSVDDGKSCKTFSAEDKKKLREVNLQPLNAVQKQALALMKQKLYDDMLSASQFEEVVSERRLLRFLRGMNFDIELAVSMFRDMLRWRKENDVDAIRTDIVENDMTPADFPHAGRVQRYYMSNMQYGHDEHGRPIHVEQIGKTCVKKLLSSFSEEEWIRHHIYQMEYLMLELDRISKEQGKLVRIVSIYDLRGLSKEHLHRGAIKLFKKTIKVTQNYYPEMMENCFFINSPKLFTMAWAMIKPWISERTVKKIEILGSKYQRRLRNSVGAEHLPETYGGKAKDQWPLDVPSSETFEQDYKSISLKRKANQKIQVHVDAGKKIMDMIIHSKSLTSRELCSDLDSFLVWGFFCSNGEVSFSASFKPTNEASVPIQCEGQMDSCGGSYEASVSGSVELYFSNDSSWLSTKHVCYYIYWTSIEEKTKLDSPKRGKLFTAFV